MWVRYFTSSVEVHRHTYKFGPPPVINIISIHETAQAAIDAESRLLRDNRVNRLDNFLNLSAGKAFAQTPDQKARRAASLKVAYQDEALRARISQRTKEAWEKSPERRKAASTKGRNRQNHKLYSYNGFQKSAEQWTENLTISAHQFQKRMVMGWSVERALQTPVRARGPNKKKD